MKRYTPTDSMRTNSLSLEPGGSEVKVIKKGFELIYTKIKRPRNYVAKLLKEDSSNEIIAIYVDDSLLYTESNTKINTKKEEPKNCKQVKF